MSVATKIINKYIEIVHSCCSDVTQVGVSVAIPVFSQKTLIDLCRVIQLSELRRGFVDLDDDVIVVGDLHGNLHNLLHIFIKYGFPPKTKYLFLGNITEFGEYSLEVVTLLFAYHVQYPTCVTLLRGNTESISLGIYRGLQSDIDSTYKSQTVRDAITNVFSFLPFCAIIFGNIFCCQPETVAKYASLDEIRIKESHVDIHKDEVAYSKIIQLYHAFDENKANQFAKVSSLDFIVMGSCSDDRCCDNIGSTLFLSASAPEVSSVLPIKFGEENQIEVFESVESIDRIKAKFTMVKDNILKTPSKNAIIIPNVVSRPQLNKITAPSGNIHYTKSFYTIPKEDFQI